jgi:hypothetical protein
MTVTHGFRRSGNLEFDCVAKTASGVGRGLLLRVAWSWAGKAEGEEVTLQDNRHAAAFEGGFSFNHLCCEQTAGASIGGLLSKISLEK